ncbi:MAG: hypothetical protein LBC97_00080 [Bifidobacteriaceae bacterium]|jgi:hypothetical protein|nr:hypothetical protein [Bifidobacteriaceae bacterium]
MATIPPERLRRFQDAAPAGRNLAVIDMYVLDSQLSGEFYSLFRATEVLLRETIHQAMSQAWCTPYWFSRGQVRQSLDTRVLEGLDSARRAARVRRGTPAPGSVVAQVMLGTWLQLLARGANGQQEALVWVPALSRAFQADLPAQPHSRAQVYALAQRLVWARNRVFHCEPVVFGFPLPGFRTRDGRARRATPHQILDDVRSLAGMTSRAARDWLGSWDRIDSLLADPLADAALAYMGTRPRLAMEGRRRPAQQRTPAAGAPDDPRGRASV